MNDLGIGYSSVLLIAMIGGFLEDKGFELSDVLSKAGFFGKSYFILNGNIR
jgi:hypothetical protein